MNGTWKSDSFPASWREALIILIPKPGKASHSLLCQRILLSGSHPAIEVDDSAQGLGDYPWRLIEISVPHHSNYDCIPSNPRNLFHGAPVEHGSDLCCAIFRRYQGGSTWWMKNTKISGCTLHGRWRKLLGIYINSVWFQNYISIALVCGVANESPMAKLIFHFLKWNFTNHYIHN